MATITGLTAERMLEIEGQSVVDGDVVGDHLILTKHDGSTVDAGLLPPGPQGPVGPAGGLMPGEIKLWSGLELPSELEYGKWVWADGAVYDVATYPKAAATIAPAWRTFGGASDPPPGVFRVPDLRGLVPAGMDQMPGLGSIRANRLTRSVAIVIAGKTGEETHIITIPEMAAHSHGVTDPGHNHRVTTTVAPIGNNSAWQSNADGPGTAPYTTTSLTGITIGTSGSGAGHENMQPTVFVPYIVKLD